MTDDQLKRLRQTAAAQRAWKSLAASDESGAIEVLHSPWLEIDANGLVLHPEFHLSSRSFRNLNSCLWFERPVAIGLELAGAQRWHLSGVPVKAHVCGPFFRSWYERLRAQLGDVDLAAVFAIRVDEAVEEDLVSLQAREDSAHPFYRHLDRLTVPASVRAEVTR